MELGDRMTSNILKEFLHNFPMQVMAAYPYFGTFVCFELVDIDGQSVRIRINMADWILKNEESVLATSDFEIDQSRIIFNKLIGGKLVDILQFDEKTLELKFNDYYSVVVSANLSIYDEEDELLTIYVPGKYGINYSLKNGFLKEVEVPPLH